MAGWLNGTIQWFMHNRLLSALIGGGVLVIAAGIVLLCVLLPKGVADQAVDAAVKAENDEEQASYQQQIAAGEMDDETRAGLIGEGLTDEEDPGDVPAEKLSYENKTTVGILCGDTENKTTAGFGKYFSALGDNDQKPDAYFIYNSNGNPNQQIQDFRSLVNKNCKAVVISDIDASICGVINELASRNEIFVIAVDPCAELECDVKIIASNTAEIYADKIKNVSGSGVVAYIGENENSAAKANDKALKSIFSGTGISYSGALYRNDASYEAGLASLTAKRPAALVADGSQAVDLLGDLAKKDAVPPLFCADATVGLLKAWNSLKNGYEAVLTPATETTPAVTKNVKITNASIYAALPVASEDIGKIAARFAHNIALGKALERENDETVEFSVKSDEIIDDVNFMKYYGENSGEKDSKKLYASAHVDSVDGLFK